MTIRARCGSCHREYQVRDSFAGRRVPCKTCGADFLVPRIAAEASVPVAEFLDDDTDDFAQSFSPQQKRSRSATRSSARRSPARPAKRSQKPSRGKGLLIGAGIGVAVVVVGIGAVFAIRAFRKGSDPVSPEGGFNVADAKVPTFPDLPRGRTLPDGTTVHFVDLAKAGNSSDPAMRMKMRVYLPAGKHANKSIGCVLVAPAGTTLLHGNDMDNDNYHKETLPYARAGYAVVFYSIDGPLPQRKPTDEQAKAAYKKFKSGESGRLEWPQRTGIRPREVAAG